MKNKTVWIMIVCCVLLCASAMAEVRTYRQVKSFAVMENGKVRESDDKGDLFQFTFNIDTANNKVTRTEVLRLDERSATADATEYTITGTKHIVGSDAGNGDDVIVATQKGGNEILELGRRSALITRTSPFMQMISGVYRRVYDKDDI
jgi:hypothetical protein